MTIEDAIKRTADGDDAAFGYVVSTLTPAVTRYIASVVNNPERIDDLVQETFAKALEHASQFRGDASGSTWILTIARNASYAQLRRDRRDDETFTVFDLGCEAGFGSLSDPERIASLKEEQAIVHEAIAALPVDDREVILLRDIEGYSGQETAHILDLTLAATKTRLHRARLKLLAELKKRLDR